MGPAIYDVLLLLLAISFAACSLLALVLYCLYHGMRYRPPETAVDSGANGELVIASGAARPIPAVQQYTYEVQCVAATDDGQSSTMVT